MSGEQDLYSDKNTTSRLRGTKGFFLYSPRQVVYVGMPRCFPKMFSFQTFFYRTLDKLRTNLGNSNFRLQNTN